MSSEPSKPVVGGDPWDAPDPRALRAQPPERPGAVDPHGERPAAEPAAEPPPPVEPVVVPEGVKAPELERMV
ncbi:MAG: hypothetical protein ABMA64_39205, partial [Myxococcota bacterium]